jgi:HEAT repeat protein
MGGRDDGCGTGGHRPRRRWVRRLGVLCLVALILAGAGTWGYWRLTYPARRAEILLEGFGPQPPVSAAEEILRKFGLASERADASQDDVARELWSLGPRAVPVLVEGLGRPNLQVKTVSRTALAKIGDSRAIPALAVLAGQEGSVEFPGRLHGIPSIAAIGGPEAVAPLLNLIEHPPGGKPKQGRWAALALGHLEQPEAVEPLLALLESKAPPVRRAAAVALGCIGDRRAIGPIARHLYDTSFSIRSDVAAALANLGDPAAIGPLTDAMADTNYIPREAPAEALGFLGDARAVGPLAALLNVGGEASEVLAEALGRIGDPAALPYLTQALANKSWGARRGDGVSGRRALIEPAEMPFLDHDPLAGPPHPWQPSWRGARHAAVVALGLIGDRQAVPTLLAALEDKDPWVCRAAVEALILIGDPAARPALVAAVAKAGESLFDPVAKVRTLARIGGPQAIAELTALLGHRNAFLRAAAAEALSRASGREAVEPLLAAMGEKDWGLRRLAASGLGWAGDPRAIPALVKALRDDDDGVRESAMAAIGWIGDPAATEQVLDALGDEEDYCVKLRASEALGRIGDPAAVSGLVRILRNRNFNFRRNAVKFLGFAGDPSSAPAVAGMLQDPEVTVRIAAAEALGAMGRAIASKSSPGGPPGAADQHMCVNRDLRDALRAGRLPLMER